MSQLLEDLFDETSHRRLGVPRHSQAPRRPPGAPTNRTARGRGDGGPAAAGTARQLEGWMALTDEAIDRIKNMITSGELRPGDRLPKEADLADRLGLSRNSLREAVRALSLIHVLDVRQGDGTYVTSLEPQLLLETMSFVVDFHRDDSIRQFLEIRHILEPAATELATWRMTDQQLDQLGAILAELPDDPSVDELVANDLRFHREIAVGAGNPSLASLLESLSAPTVRARVWRGLTQEGAVQRTREQHAAIHAAMVSRNPDVARAWATVHVAGVEDWLHQTLTEPQATAAD